MRSTCDAATSTDDFDPVTVNITESECKITALTRVVDGLYFCSRGYARGHSLCLLARGFQREVVRSEGLDCCGSGFDSRS